VINPDFSALEKSLFSHHYQRTMMNRFFNRYRKGGCLPWLIDRADSKKIVKKDNFGNVIKEHKKIVIRQFSNAERLQKIFY